jgi:hypothetical protein
MPDNWRAVHAARFFVRRHNSCLFGKGAFSEQSSTATGEFLWETHTCGWSRQPSKIEQ